MVEDSQTVGALKTKLETLEIEVQILQRSWIAKKACLAILQNQLWSSKIILEGDLGERRENGFNAGRSIVELRPSNMN